MGVCCRDLLEDLVDLGAGLDALAIGPGIIGLLFAVVEWTRIARVRFLCLRVSHSIVCICRYLS